MAKGGQHFHAKKQSVLACLLAYCAFGWPKLYAEGILVPELENLPPMAMTAFLETVKPLKQAGIKVLAEKPTSPSASDHDKSLGSLPLEESHKLFADSFDTGLKADDLAPQQKMPAAAALPELREPNLKPTDSSRKEARSPKISLAHGDESSARITVRVASGSGNEIKKKKTASVAPSRSLPTSTHKEQGQTSLSLHRQQDGSLKIEPARLTARPGESIPVQLAGLEAELPTFFVRHHELLEWNGAQHEIVAKKRGQSEIMIYFNSQLYLLPVEIEGPQAKGGSKQELLSQLELPRQLVSLQGLTFSAEQAIAAASPTSRDKNSRAVKAFTKPRSEDEVSSPVGATNPFHMMPQSLAFAKVRLQIIDEQSQLASKELIPAKGVRLSIVGTEYNDTTDAKGMSSEIHVPENARFFVSLKDDYGYYRPSILEVDTASDADENGIIQLKLMQNAIYHSLLAIAEENPSLQQASLCGYIRQEDEKPWQGISIKSDSGSQQGYFFNSYGLFDPRQTVTGADGRFCLFGLEAGPIALDFYEGDKLVDTIPFATFAGMHSEQDFTLGDRIEIKTHLAAMLSAEEQRHLSENEANRYQPIDMAELIAIGDDTPFEQDDYGLVSSIVPMPVHKGRSCYVANTPEFEMAHYCYRREDSSQGHVTPLVPNGFIEKMSYFYNVELDLDPVSWDPLLGTVMVEHSAWQDQERGEEFVNITLVDNKGQVVGEGVHYGESPVTKALFFNVPPGSYTAIVKDREQSWLAIDTVMVYSQTLSYLHTGSELRYFSNNLSQVD